LGGWEKKKRGGGLKGSAFIALSARASSRDVMQAVLQVAHLRCLPFRVDLSASEGREWATRESATRAARDVDEFMRCVLYTGSHTTPHAWWMPILKDFARRVSPPTPRFQSPSSTPFNSN